MFLVQHSTLRSPLKRGVYLWNRSIFVTTFPCLSWNKSKVFINDHGWKTDNEANSLVHFDSPYFLTLNLPSLRCLWSWTSVSYRLPNFDILLPNMGNMNWPSLPTQLFTYLYPILNFCHLFECKSLEHKLMKERAYFVNGCENCLRWMMYWYQTKYKYTPRSEASLRRKENIVLGQNTYIVDV